MSIRNKAILAVIAGNTIFGFSFLFSKVALQITVPSVMIAIRFTMAFLVLNLIVAAGRIIRKPDGSRLVDFSLKGKPLKYVVMLAIFQPVLYFLAESYGITLTSSAFAGTIIAVIPIMGIVFDVLIMRAAVSARQIICAVVSVAGVIVTTLGAENMQSSVLGTLILLIAVVAGAIFYVFSKKAGEHYSPLERTYVMFAVGSVTYIVFALIQCVGRYDELVRSAVQEPAFWGCILYLAVASSVLAFLALNFGSSYISVSEASLFANLTTVISILAGVIILHETFTVWQIAGAVMILGSVYISGRNNTGDEAEASGQTGI